MLNQLVWFDVPCRDLDRAIAFYSAVLGCEIEKEGGTRPNGTPYWLGVLPHEDKTVGGCLFVNEKASPSDHGILIYFNCRGRLHEATAAVEPRGGKVLEHVHPIGSYGFRSVVLDSEGNRIALHSV
jgi:predicted enzyme related to lactoylglutathione lyase